MKSISLTKTTSSISTATAVATKTTVTTTTAATTSPATTTAKTFEIATAINDINVGNNSKTLAVENLCSTTAAATVSATCSTTTATISANNSPATTALQPALRKSVFLSANGKQLVFSNKNFIKLSPNALSLTGTPTSVSSTISTINITTAATTTKPQNTMEVITSTTASAAAAAPTPTPIVTPTTIPGISAKLHAVQIPGKPGVQYVRLVNDKTKINTTTSSNIIEATTNYSSSSFSAAATTSSATKTISAIKLSPNANSTVAVASVAAAGGSISGVGNISGSSVVPTSGIIKVFNSMTPQKFTVVRPSGGKIVLTQSPKKDGSTSVTFTPVTSKVQKAIVTVPSLRQQSSVQPTKPVVKIGGQMLVTNVSAAGLANVVRKHKISEMNTEIQRITSGSDSEAGPSQPKKYITTANGERFLVMPSPSMARAGFKAIQPRSGVVRYAVQGTSNFKNVSSNAVASSSSSGSVSGGATEVEPKMFATPKKVYSVLKKPQSPVASTDRKIMMKQQIVLTQDQQRQLQNQRKICIKRPLDEVVFSQEYPQAKKLPTLYASSHSTVEDDERVSGSPPFLELKIKEEPIEISAEELMPPPPAVEEEEPVVRRKHCNCSKSQCLKLYCDCFANGEFCQDCTCKDCFNNLQYQDERQRAIRSCLDRNPSAFKPKIISSENLGDLRLHNKGCNCKRSGCLKNYCECYEAKIPCSSNCKCVGCRNVEERSDYDLETIDPKILASITSGKVNTVMLAADQKRSYDRAMSTFASAAAAGDEEIDIKPSISTLFAAGLAAATGASASSATTMNTQKDSCNVITQEVIDATLQCMLSQADECLKLGLPAFQIERLILEELGRCLVEIIDFSIRNPDNSLTQE